MAFDPRNPHHRHNPALRAAMHGAMGAALTGAALHAVGSENHAPIAIAGLMSGAAGVGLARAHNRSVDAYEAQHGSGPAKRSVVGRTILHGMAGGWAGRAVGAAADHVLGTHDLSNTLGAVGQVGGWVHGYRSSRAHNAMVDALVHARAHKATLTGAIKNATFEAKHRRVHGKFVST